MESVEKKAKKTAHIGGLLFSRLDIALMAIFTIVGGFVYGSVYGAFYTFAYSFLALLGVLLGCIPFYGWFLYNGWFQSWLNNSMTQWFPFHLTGLTWFIFLVGSIFAAITCIAVSAVVVILIGVVVVAILD